MAVLCETIVAGNKHMQTCICGRRQAGWAREPITQTGPVPTVCAQRHSVVRAVMRGKRRPLNNKCEPMTALLSQVAQGTTSGCETTRSPAGPAHAAQVQVALRAQLPVWGSRNFREGGRVVAGERVPLDRGTVRVQLRRTRRRITLRPGSYPSGVRCADVELERLHRPLKQPAPPAPPAQPVAQEVEPRELL